MRHGKKIAKLGRTSSHRKALMRNMATSLIQRERITTTADKAKALRPYIEKLITRAKNDTLHNKREVMKKITDRKVIVKLFTDVAPRYSKRPGGYTRIFKLGTRPGDAAEMAIIELVEEEVASSSKKKKKPAAAIKPAPVKEDVKTEEAAEAKPAENANESVDSSVSEETSAPAEEAPAPADAAAPSADEDKKAE